MKAMKQKVLSEVLVEMDKTINYSLNQTNVDEREDLKQDITIKILEAAEKMEVIPFSDFKSRYKKEEE